MKDCSDLFETIEQDQENNSCHDGLLHWIQPRFSLEDLAIIFSQNHPTNSQWKDVGAPTSTMYLQPLMVVNKQSELYRVPGTYSLAAVYNLSKTQKFICSFWSFYRWKDSSVFGILMHEVAAMIKVLLFIVLNPFGLMCKIHLRKPAEIFLLKIFRNICKLLLMMTRCIIKFIRLTHAAFKLCSMWETIIRDLLHTLHVLQLQAYVLGCSSDDSTTPATARFIIAQLAPMSGRGGPLITLTLNLWSVPQCFHL